MKLIGWFINTIILICASAGVFFWGCFLVFSIFYTVRHRELTPYDIRHSLSGIGYIFLSLCMIRGIGVKV